MVGAGLLGERPCRDSGVAGADEEALRGVEERLLGLPEGYRRRSQALTMYTIVARCRRERRHALLEWDAADVGDGHWKISVVQSPPWRRTSCVRAGSNSTKKPGSSSMPPSGSQFTRSSHERSPG